MATLVVTRGDGFWGLTGLPWETYFATEAEAMRVAAQIDAGHVETDFEQDATNQSARDYLQSQIESVRTLAEATAAALAAHLAEVP
jgi:hypothetical protein